MKPEETIINYHFTIDLYYGIIVFAGGFLFWVTDRADFYIPQMIMMMISLFNNANIVS